MDSTPRARNISQIAILVAFAIGLLAPSVGMITGWSADIAAIEFRNAASRPTIPIDIRQLETFPSRMDAFLEDHFGFRSQWLTLNSLLHVAIGVSPTPKFVLGKEGWFFHRSMDDALDQYRGINRFTPRELEHWVRIMEANQRAMANRGIRMLIAIPPSKPAIYPEYLPDWVNVVHEKGRYEQLLARLAKGSPLEIVDLAGPLRQAKKRYPVYYKNDGHWNELGAYAAYAAIVERIQETYPEVPLRPLDFFEVAWAWESSGAITNRLNITESRPEEVPRLRPRSGSHMTREVWPDGIPEGVLDSLHATKVIESDLSDQPTVVFVRDSFSTDIALFARESFHRTVLIHHGYGGFRRGLILQYEPDIVVYEMIERGLIWRQRIEKGGP